MSALITIADIEAVLNDTADADETALWTFYIDLISDYINNYVDVSFETVENHTERLQADYYGEITLKGPVTSIANVTDFRTGMSDLFVDWDGINKLYYLMPLQVVDVTWSYGYAAVPDDIKNLTTQLVLSQINGSAPTNLSEFKVGDVDEKYRDTQLSELFDEMSMNTLGQYITGGGNSFTINVAGADQFPDYLSSQSYLLDFD